MEKSSMFESSTVEAGGKTFTVRELSVKQRADIYEQYKKDKDATAMSANLVMMGCAEFVDKSIDDVYELPGRVFDIISTAVADVSGMSPEKDDDDGDAGKKS